MSFAPLQTLPLRQYPAHFDQEVIEHVVPLLTGFNQFISIQDQLADPDVCPSYLPSHLHVDIHNLGRACYLLLGSIAREDNLPIEFLNRFEDAHSLIKAVQTHLAHLALLEGAGSAKLDNEVYPTSKWWGPYSINNTPARWHSPSPMTACTTPPNSPYLRASNIPSWGPPIPPTPQSPSVPTEQETMDFLGSVVSALQVQTQEDLEHEIFGTDSSIVDDRSDPSPEAPPSSPSPDVVPPRIRVRKPTPEFLDSLPSNRPQTASRRPLARVSLPDTRGRSYARVNATRFVQLPKKPRCDVCRRSGGHWGTCIKFKCRWCHGAIRHGYGSCPMYLSKRERRLVNREAWARNLIDAQSSSTHPSATPAPSLDSLPSLEDCQSLGYPSSLSSFDDEIENALGLE